MPTATDYGHTSQSASSGQNRHLPTERKPPLTHHRPPAPAAQTQAPAHPSRRLWRCRVWGVTVTAVLGADVPAVVQATTVTLYVVPFLRPSIVQLWTFLVAQKRPPGLAMAA